jgi:hypothetical protein
MGVAQSFGRVPKMRPSLKLKIADAIAREMKRRYTIAEMETYLEEFEIRTPHYDLEHHDELSWVKTSLRGVEGGVLSEIAEDLEINPSSENILKPPKNWPDDSKFRLFISHISKDKDKATRLRQCLAAYHISGFVAHEDIHPTLQWQTEIERALHAMDAFLAIHTKGFSASVWTQQEIGFAVARGVKIISFKMGEDPTGFISKHQALPRLDRKAEDIAKEVYGLLLADDLTADRIRFVDFVDSPAQERALSDIPF